MKRLIFVMAIGATVVAVPASAQEAAGHGRPGWGHHEQTRAEALQRADMLFQLMDTNRDGLVTKAEAEQALAEFEASRGGIERTGSRMQRMLDQVFASAQSLSLQQFEAQALARFDAEDLNHDGKISADERQQARGEPSQRPPGEQSDTKSTPQ